jgi:hypothetical protein
MRLAFSIFPQITQISADNEKRPVPEGQNICREIGFNGFKVP